VSTTYGSGGWGACSHPTAASRFPQ
jgi:hypothetical protein